MDEVPWCQAYHPTLGIPVHAVAGWIRRDDHVRVQVRDHHPIAGRLKDAPVLLLFLEGRGFRKLTLCDVLNLGDAVHRVALRIPHQRDAEHAPHDVPLFMQVALLHLVMVDLAGQQAAKMLDIGINVIGMGHGLEGPLQHLGFGVTGHLTVRVVHLEELTRRRDERHADRRVIKCPSEPGLAVLKILFGTFLLGDVDHHPAQLHRAAILAEHGDDVAEPNDSAVRRDHAVLELVRLALGSGICTVRNRPRPVVRVHVVLPEGRLLEPASDGVTEQPLRLLADERELHGRWVRFPDDAVDRVHQVFVLLARLAERGVCLDPAGGIERDAYRPDDGAGRIVEWLDLTVPGPAPGLRLICDGLSGARAEMGSNRRIIGILSLKEFGERRADKLMAFESARSQRGALHRRNAQLAIRGPDDPGDLAGRICNE